MVDVPAPTPAPAGFVILTSTDATRVAVHYANTLAPGHEFVEAKEKAVQHWFGWVVFVAPQKYLQTGDPGELVPGISAFVVEHQPRQIVSLPSSIPFERALAEYERRKKATMPFRAMK